MTAAHSAGYWRIRDTLDGLGYRVNDRGSTLRTRCPAKHHRTRTQLDVTDMGDRVLIHCHAGCAPEEVLAALGVTWADVFENTTSWKGITKSGRAPDAPPPRPEPSPVPDPDHLVDRIDQHQHDLDDPGYWMGRAAEWQDAAPKPGQFTGAGTVEQLNEAVARCKSAAEACLQRAYALAPGPDGDAPPAVALETFTEQDLIPVRATATATMRKATDRVRAAEDARGQRRDRRFWLTDDELAKRREAGP